MSISPFNALTCPLDGVALQPSGQSWCCPSGHRFDVARQGYVNLLPVQRKRSLDPGDSKEMVAARQHFLEAGFYQPLARRIALRLLADVSAATGPLSCLDAGCGEGYYLRQLTLAAAQGPDLVLAGLDISKWAVMAAARSSRQIRWIVGSNARLPVPDASLDRLLCLFGFPVYAEFARVLRPGGLLLLADPAPGHLLALREIIYPEIRPPREQPPAVPAGFVLQDNEALTYDIHLDSAGLIADLLLMTPHMYRASAAGRARLATLASLALTVDVRIACLRREG